MNKNKFRNVKKQENKKNKKIVEIIIIEKKQPAFQYNKILYLVPLLFLLFNSGHLIMFAPLIYLGFTWINNSNELVPQDNLVKTQIEKDNLLKKDHLNIMCILPILFILFILFFVFFYVFFSYSRANISLPCIQSCDTILNDVSSNLDISSSMNI
jgi:hypothetical protein